MQASKIKFSTTYAIRWHDKLVRFNPTKVITERVNDTGSPHDYTSEVVGTIVAPDNNGVPLTIKIEPSKLLGEYSTHVELVKREAAEKAARERETKARDDERKELVALLFKVAGLQQPEPGNKRHGGSNRTISLIHGRSYGGVDIDQDAVAPLLAGLKALLIADVA